MTYTNIVSKLFLLLKLIFKYKILFFSILLLIFVYIYSKKNVFLAKGKNFIILFLLLFDLCFYIMKNISFIGKTYNELILNIFKNIYFPSVYFIIFIYLFLLILFIIINIKKCNNLYKKIINVSFVSVNILMILIINIISDNKINIFSKKSLYTNQNLLCTLEMIVLIFILTIIILLILLLSNYLLTIIENKFKINNNNFHDQPLLSNIKNDNNEYNKEGNGNYVDDSCKSNIIVNSTENIDNLISPISEYDKFNRDFYLNDDIKDNKKFKYKSTPNLNQLEVVKKPQIILPNNNLNDKVNDNSIQQNKFTVDDLKTILKILKLIKIHSRNNIITKEEAIRIIKENNYSENDYKKFIKIINEIVLQK